MRILHVITALGVGGAERMLSKLVAARVLAGTSQHVIAMLPGGAVAPALRASGAPVDELNFLGSVPVLGGTFRLARLARKLDPDIVHGWLYHGNLGAAVARAALPRRVPLVWSIRQSLAELTGENVPARIAIALNKAWSGHPDCLLFNSRTSMAQHRSRGFTMDRSEYLPNGFDTAAYSPDPVARARARATLGAGDDQVVIGMFARYHPSKDHAGFLEAAGRLRAARPGAQFVMAGTGVNQHNGDLAAAIRRANLAGHVQMLGERHDVSRLLPALDVYVSASGSVEAFSNSIGEAMCCGVPCVVTDTGDSAAIVADTGRVVRPRDTAALAEGMLAMVDLGAAGRANLGSRARQRILDEFDLEVVARQYGALYARMMSTPGTAN